MKFFDRIRIYLAALLALFALSVWGLVIGSRPVSNEPRLISVTVDRGASARQVADVLKTAHLIRSTTVFVLTCRLTGEGSKLKPGVYGVSKSMSVQQLIHHLVSGETIEAKLTIPEGYTIRQIADELQTRQFATSDSFVRLTLTQGFQFPNSAFLFGHNLEGYLFPDTYLFQRGADINNIVETMLSNFQRKVVRPYKADIEKVGKERFGLGPDKFNDSLYKILIMASLVEREARLAKDRPVIAAVLWNRLKKHIRLEICATVSYIPGESRENKAKVYVVDTKSVSPYNTYQIYGLPPTPICNPGIASIKAVMNPANVDYLYYVAKGDGGHIFSRTFKEHLAAKKAVETSVK